MRGMYKKKGSDALNYNKETRMLHLLFDSIKNGGVYITQSGKKNYKMEFRGKLFDEDTFILHKYEFLI